MRDALHDPLHCGACGNTCAENAVCALGVCRIVAPSLLSLGYATQCALDGDRAVRCWGSFRPGELGMPNLDDEPRCLTASIPTPRALSSQGTAHCAVDASGVATCWGVIPLPGYDVPYFVPLPQTQHHLPFALDVSVGTSGACVVSSANAVSCWGVDNDGAFGRWNPSEPYEPREPVVLPDVNDVAQVSIGFHNACALRRDSTVWCWGTRGSGVIPGFGVDTARTPVSIAGAQNIVSIATGILHACAADASGNAYCWGNNSRGQLGSRFGSALQASRVDGLSDVVQVAVGYLHSCARVSSGTVWCWGDNARGQLGDGTAIGRMTPRPVSGLADAVELTSHADFSCARRRTGAVVCWGQTVTRNAWGPVLTTPTPTTCIRGCPDGTTWCAGECTAGRCLR